MFKRTIPITTIKGVGAGQVATVEIPTEYRYHQLYFRYTENGVDVTEANMKAAITSVDLRLNGKSQRQYTAAELITLNKRKGFAYQDGVLPVFFAEPDARTPGGEDTLAWAIEGNASTFTAQITIAAGRVSPKLEVSAIVDNARGPNGKLLPLGPIIKTRKFNKGVSAVGLVTMTNDIPRELGDIRALHFFETAAADIKSVVVKVDQVVAFERDRVLNNAIQKQLGFVPDAAVFHADFMENGRPEDRLPTSRPGGKLVGELRMDIDMATANDFAILVEYLGQPD